MMTLPHEAVAPEQTSLAIARFLTRGRQTYRSSQGMKLPATCAAIRSGIFERTCTIQTSELTMFGILSEPGPNVPSKDLCVLYLNPGGVRHIGPNRMWVESARRWAESGVISLRLDLQGIGESEGEQVLDIPNLYHGRLVRQIEAAMDWVRDRLGIKRFAAIGLCSGAFWAFHAALRNPEIRAAVLLNPRLFFWDPGVDPRRMVRRTVRGLTQWSDWSRLFRGGIRAQDVVRVARVIAGAFGRKRSEKPDESPIAQDSAEQAWSLLEHLQQRVLLVFREGEPLLQELEEARQLPPKSGSFVRSLRVPNGGHTFRPLWAQQMCHEIIDRELTALTGAPAAPRVLSPDAARV
jgi:pimeloyl-ACP methyl ester carboxylesterase